MTKTLAYLSVETTGQVPRLDNPMSILAFLLKLLVVRDKLSQLRDEVVRDREILLDLPPDNDAQNILDNDSILSRKLINSLLGSFSTKFWKFLEMG